MDKLLKEIISYLDYLMNQCKLSVSIHFSKNKIKGIPERAWIMLLPYNMHKNPYCIMIKSNEENKRRCLVSQQMTMEKCNRYGCFCGVCYAGVCEYIYPILENEMAVGYIAVSGYRKYEPPNRNINLELWEKSLDSKAIPKELCDVLIPPLNRMLELLINTSVDCTESEYNLMIQFMNEHYNQISIEVLCREFGRSKSYISHMFKSKSGVTIRTYCNNLKLENAKNLLIKTDIPIMEIALDVGFCDESYFIFLFKRKYFMTPLQYRKKYR